MDQVHPGCATTTVATPYDPAPYDPNAVGALHRCERAIGAMTGLTRSRGGSDRCPEEVWPWCSRLVS